jgi:hypothetical protein
VALEVLPVLRSARVELPEEAVLGLGLGSGLA